MGQNNAIQLELFETIDRTEAVNRRVDELLASHNAVRKSLHAKHNSLEKKITELTLTCADLHLLIDELKLQLKISTEKRNEKIDSCPATFDHLPLFNFAMQPIPERSFARR